MGLGIYRAPILEMVRVMRSVDPPGGHGQTRVMFFSGKEAAWDLDVGIKPKTKPQRKRIPQKILPFPSAHPIWTSFKNFWIAEEFRFFGEIINIRLRPVKKDFFQNQLSVPV